MSIQKTLAWGSALPLALSSLVGLSGSANAAALIPFQNFDQFNITSNVQFNIAISSELTVSGDVRPGVDTPGDNALDFIFVPPNAGQGDGSTSPTNYIVDNNDPECPSVLAAYPPNAGNIGCTVDTDPGERSQVSAGFGNSGAFRYFNTTDIVGSIRSFDQAPNFPGNPGTYLPNNFDFPLVSIVDTQGRLFQFTLDGYDVTRSSQVPGQPPGTFLLDIVGRGRVRQYTGNTPTGSFFEASHQWFLTGQLLNDSGTGNDFVFDDGISGVTSLSASFIITSVPEPTGVIGSIVALGVGLLTTKKKKS